MRRTQGFTGCLKRQRRAGRDVVGPWAQASAQTPLRGLLTFLILLYCRSGHRTGIDAAVHEAIACIGRQPYANGMAGSLASSLAGRGQAESSLASWQHDSPLRRWYRCSMLPMSH
ncbi:hypothetical protein AOQ84DRAFT_52549 [Glonium stellatum]|uniref:Uncharacterized protein n=1 Tax=Glonium stellatum TaxID=574774 RepID=A0A8E2JSA1_9PEZI|nr:hypothetical protein AOQ84DRAFT_52549 [Glonium stellatum]